MLIRFLLFTVMRIRLTKNDADSCGFGTGSATEVLIYNYYIIEIRPLIQPPII
jgi:hypothetical protein